MSHGQYNTTHPLNQAFCGKKKIFVDYAKILCQSFYVYRETENADSTRFVLESTKI